jgi:hypothetical protein
MKSISLKFLLFISIISVLTGCVALHQGSMSGSASLSSPNFLYTSQNLTGEAKATYVLGIGGVSRQSLVAEAKRAMLINNPLRNNQALTNLAVSYKTTGYIGFIVATVKCTVTADVVEFGRTQTEFSQAQSPVLQSDPSVTSTTYPHPETKEPVKGMKFKIGDQVRIVNYFNKPVDGKIIDAKKGKYIVEYTTSKNKTKGIIVPEYQLKKID